MFVWPIRPPISKPLGLASPFSLTPLRLPISRQCLDVETEKKKRACGLAKAREKMKPIASAVCRRRRFDSSVFFLSLNLNQRPKKLTSSPTPRSSSTAPMASRPRPPSPSWERSWASRPQTSPQNSPTSARPSTRRSRGCCPTSAASSRPRERTTPRRPIWA